MEIKTRIILIIENKLYVNSQDWLMQRLQLAYVQLVVEVK